MAWLLDVSPHSLMFVVLSLSCPSSKIGDSQIDLAPGVWDGSRGQGISTEVTDGSHFFFNRKSRTRFFPILWPPLQRASGVVARPSLSLKYSQPLRGLGQAPTSTQPTLYVGDGWVEFAGLHLVTPFLSLSVFAPPHPAHPSLEFPASPCKLPYSAPATR